MLYCSLQVVLQQYIIFENGKKHCKCVIYWQHAKLQEAHRLPNLGSPPPDVPAQHQCGKKKPGVKKGEENASGSNKDQGPHASGN